MAGPERITVEEWHRSGGSEAVHGMRRELLDGEAVEMPDVSNEHTDTISRIGDLLRATVGEQATVAVRTPLILDEFSEPRPDVAVVAPDSTAILLVVEVADSSFTLIYDRGRKAAYYARSGVPECWVVDLQAQQVLLHRSPASGGYRDIRNLRRGSSPLTLVGVAGAEVAVDAVFASTP